MSTNSFFAKFLRFIGIALMGLTAAFTLLGGAGTCVGYLSHPPRNYGIKTGIMLFYPHNNFLGAV